MSYIQQSDFLLLYYNFDINLSALNSRVFVDGGEGELPL